MPNIFCLQLVQQQILYYLVEIIISDQENTYFAEMRTVRELCGQHTTLKFKKSGPAQFYLSLIEFLF